MSVWWLWWWWQLGLVCDGIEYTYVFTVCKTMDEWGGTKRLSSHEQTNETSSKYTTHLPELRRLPVASK